MKCAEAAALARPAGPAAHDLVRAAHVRGSIATTRRYRSLSCSPSPRRALRPVLRGGQRGCQPTNSSRGHRRKRFVFLSPATRAAARCGPRDGSRSPSSSPRSPGRRCRGNPTRLWVASISYIPTPPRRGGAAPLNSPSRLKSSGGAALRHGAGWNPRPTARCTSMRAAHDLASSANRTRARVL